MKKLFFLLACVWAQDPRTAIELFRLGRYQEAYPLFKRLFERTQDYLWGSYAVECLLQTDKREEYTRWIQSERTKNRLSPWGTAWELRKRSLRGDTLANAEWEAFLRRSDLSLPTIEALAEVSHRIWGQTEWQRAALYAARRLNPHPAAYAELLITSYEKDNLWVRAWREWLLLWKAREVPRDTLLWVLQRLTEIGVAADSLEQPLLEQWQESPHPTLARALQRLYTLSTDFSEALRYAKAVFRLEHDCNPLYEVGWNAHEKGIFTPATEAFRTLIQTGESCPHYTNALTRYLQIEALLKDPHKALSLLDSLLHRFPHSIPLVLEKAGWYLRVGWPDSAYNLLETIEPTSHSFLAQKYLLLSEAALQQGNFLQARLSLLEVESRLPQSSWLSEAYFRLARLAYFQGEFELAKTRLRFLKNNTQDDLSNDAIQLFWQIEDNLKPDTLTEPLRLYARAELYLLQNKSEEAIRLLDSIPYLYKGHPLVDDVLWKKVQYHISLRDTTSAKTYLEALANYPDSESLYRDDALYLLAQLSRTPAEEARYYERLLRETPGSLYARIAQEKLRELTR
ncbi:MAG: hypothetical protein N2170_05165 [Bacteroidia bacterium]|nr:hypothetical protein [Bacteroidia bacterium]